MTTGWVPPLTHRSSVPPSDRRVVAISALSALSRGTGSHPGTPGVPPGSGDYRETPHQPPPPLRAPSAASPADPPRHSPADPTLRFPYPPCEIWSVLVGFVQREPSSAGPTSFLLGSFECPICQSDRSALPTAPGGGSWERAPCLGPSGRTFPPPLPPPFLSLPGCRHVARGRLPGTVSPSSSLGPVSTAVATSHGASSKPHTPAPAPATIPTTTTAPAPAPAPAAVLPPILGGPWGSRVPEIPLSNLLRFPPYGFLPRCGFPAPQRLVFSCSHTVPTHNDLCHDSCQL